MNTRSEEITRAVATVMRHAKPQPEIIAGIKIATSELLPPNVAIFGYPDKPESAVIITGLSR